MLKLLVVAALLASTPALAQFKPSPKDRAAKGWGFLVDGFADPFNKAAATAGSPLRSGPAQCPPEPDDEEQTCTYELGPRLAVTITRRDGHHEAWITLRDAKDDADGALRRDAWAVFAGALNPSLSPQQARALAEEMWAADRAPTAAPPFERGPARFEPRNEQLFATTNFVPAALADETRARLREALVLNCACPDWTVSWEAYDARLRAVGVRVGRRSRSDPKAMCAPKPDDDEDDKAFFAKVAEARPTACREAERRFGPRGSVFAGVMVKAGPAR